VTTATLVESLRQVLAAANPGLATKDDLAQLEERVDELSELVSELAEKIGAGAGEKA